MITWIVLVGACIAAGMGAVKDGRVLRLTGLTGTCRVVQTSTGGQQIEACRSGKLEGAPDLTGNGCSDAGLYAGRVYWRCPAPVGSAPLP
jgi:hypothetical protein